MTARERELTAEVQRLREANRRLQAEGPALERDRLVVALRAEIAGARERVAAAHRTFTADPAKRQALNAIKGWGGFWLAVLEAAAPAAPSETPRSSD